MKIKFRADKRCLFRKRGKGYINSVLIRLFEDAISCIRFEMIPSLMRFRIIPSIAVNKVMENNAEKLMVMGYGTIGKLVVKYA